MHIKKVEIFEPSGTRIFHIVGKNGVTGISIVGEYEIMVKKGGEYILYYGLPYIAYEKNL